MSRHREQQRPATYKEWRAVSSFQRNQIGPKWSFHHNPGTVCKSLHSNSFRSASGAKSSVSLSPLYSYKTLPTQSPFLSPGGFFIKILNFRAVIDLQWQLKRASNRQERRWDTLSAMFCPFSFSSLLEFSLSRFVYSL